MKKSLVKILLAVLISVIILALMYSQVNERIDASGMNKAVGQMTNSTSSILCLVIVFLLMPVNLMCEALKWKTVTQSLVPIKITRAFGGILAGITAGLFLPNRVGEFAGKALVLPLNQFWKGSVLAVYTSMTQLMTTLLFGCIAILYFGQGFGLYIHWVSRDIVVAFAILAMALLLLFYFFPQVVANRFSRWKKLHSVFSVLSSLSMRIKFSILGLSILRYLVFSTQNLLLLWLFGVRIPWHEGFFLIALMYFILTAIPTIAVTDLPARGSVMILLFTTWFTIQGLPFPAEMEEKLILVSFVIWLVNLITPALPGLFFLNRYSLLRKEKI